MELRNPSDWREILSTPTRLWAWCARWARSEGWCRRLGDQEATAACVGAVHGALEGWLADDVPPRAFVIRAMEWAMRDMLKARSRRDDRVRPLTDRDAEEMVAPDDVLEEVSGRDELEVLLAWCGRMGRAGEMLRRRLAAETVDELAGDYGLTARQVRRIVERASQEARGRLDG